MGEEFDELKRAVLGGQRIITISQLTSSSAKAYVLARLRAATGKKLAIVAESNAELDAWSCDLEFFQGYFGEQEPSVISIPSFETDPYSGVSPHAETQERRALSLWQIARGAGDVVLLSARSAVQRTASVDETKTLGAGLVRDADLPPEELTERLIASGYVREEPIFGPGQFSLRGGIVDAWSPDSEQPVRIEFFGDTVDSIRTFDPETQLSIEQLRAVSIAPMREFAVSDRDLKDWAFFAAERFSDDRFRRNLKDRTDFAAEGETFSGWEFLLPLVRPLKGCIFDYLDDHIIVVDEPAAIEQTVTNFYANFDRSYAAVTDSGDVALAPDELFLEPERLRNLLDSRPIIELRSLGLTAAETDEDFMFAADESAGSPPYQGGVAEGRGGSFQRGDESTLNNVEPTVSSGEPPRLPAGKRDRPGSPPYQGGVAEGRGGSFQRGDESTLSSGEPPRLPAGKRGHPPLLGKEGNPLFLFSTAAATTEIEILSRSSRNFHGDIQAFTREHVAADIIVVQTSGMAERLAEMLRDYDISLPAGSIKIGPLTTGFELPSEKLRFYTEQDIFGETVAAPADTAPKTRSRKSKLGAFISDFRDLKPGDFVVHVDHGIGRFEGLQTIESQGIEREFMLLMYADNAKLFVPVERMDLVSRYSSGEAAAPTLDRLGGIGWQKTKAKAKRAMRDMADELLKLYAERKLVRGHAFPPDAPWQHEFEDAFPYDLTTDQATAIEDVKEDMENAVPMDRLIIGDVGYGKTEVAMRAAFKAVMDGKQVAILTPTTVLAYQHFETFKKRFSAFPAKIDLLSRFRTTKEQKSVAESAGKGGVDVLIGTHRILSTDVKLPNLGLVVVDEEQRFGVGHKEKLKQLKKKVDVLTLSATPIPRTLNMSLLGMRDMSVIETPPRDRLAINTQVVQFAEGVIRSAIELELSRNGQIFFIHNRVESIEPIAALIQRIVPNARIAIGHGQMNEKEMEQVMLDFIDYKYDVLVATTIIENGIDIPRANTIIINRADNYGLSQLYQLRGRVGRSNRRAYAYLLIPSELELTPIARRRLSAIREFSDLGAGFRLAALDLELRGAGNILGGQQSGHLDALGFDLYTKMLERTIAEIKGDEIADEMSVSINLGIDVSIPKEYISEAGQRLRTYKRISSAESEEELLRIHAELADRYGRIPPSVEDLFEYGRLRKLAEGMRLASIDKSKEGYAVKLSDTARIAPEKLMLLLEEMPGVSFSPSGILRLTADPENPIRSIRSALERIRG